MALYALKNWKSYYCEETTAYREGFSYLRDRKSAVGMKLFTDKSEARRVCRRLRKKFCGAPISVVDISNHPALPALTSARMKYNDVRTKTY